MMALPSLDPKMRRRGVAPEAPRAGNGNAATRPECGAREDEATTSVLAPERLRDRRHPYSAREVRKRAVSQSYDANGPSLASIGICFTLPPSSSVMARRSSFNAPATQVGDTNPPNYKMGNSATLAILVKKTVNSATWGRSPKPHMFQSPLRYLPHARIREPSLSSTTCMRRVLFITC